MASEPTTFNADDKVRGIDVSHNNGTIDWQKVAAAGIAFAFAKATESTGFVDPQFNTNYAAMKSNGLLRGSYHFFRPKSDAQAQAQNFLKVVPQLGPGDLPPTLDVEVNDGKSASDIIQGVQQWLETVGSALGCKPIIYTSASFWNANLSGTNQFADHPLWVAHYTSKAQPNIPQGFTGYTIWQFTEQGTISGISGNADLDRYNGTLDQLRKLAGLP